MIWLQYWKQILIALLLVVVGGGGFMAGRNSVPQMQTTASKDEIKETTQKTRHVVIVTKPDGTKVETIDSKVQKNKKEKKQEKTTQPSPLTAKNNYKLGLFASTDPTKLFSSPEKPTYGLALSRRLASDLWLDSSYNIVNKQFTLGLSLEW